METGSYAEKRARNGVRIRTILWLDNLTCTLFLASEDTVQKEHTQQ
jgi:hypothetical protein